MTSNVNTWEPPVNLRYSNKWIDDMPDVKLSCTKDPTCKGFYKIYRGSAYIQYKHEHVKCESGYEKRELFDISNPHHLYLKGIERQF